MTKNRCCFLWAFLIASLSGAALHFLYFSTNFFPFAFLSPLNESVWEHVKIVVIPLLAAFYVLFRLGNPELRRFLPAACLGLLTAVFLTVTVHYTLSCGLGVDGLVWDILLYFLSMAAAFFITYRMMDFEFTRCGSALLISCTLLLLVMLIVFTVRPPDLPLFIDYSV